MFLGLVVALVGACATRPAARPPEPQIIILRNATDRDCAAVTIREVRDHHAQSIRLGSASPLLRGRSFQLTRRPGAAPLPAEAEVMWTYSSGESQSVVVSLRAALGRATGAAGEALVCTVRDDGVVVNLEIVPGEVRR